MFIWETGIYKDRMMCFVNSSATEIPLAKLYWRLSDSIETCGQSAPLTQLATNIPLSRFNEVQVRCNLLNDLSSRSKQSRLLWIIGYEIITFFIFSSTTTYLPSRCFERHSLVFQNNVRVFRDIRLDNCFKELNKWWNSIFFAIENSI